jgi:hypothetical protein
MAPKPRTQSLNTAAIGRIIRIVPRSRNVEAALLIFALGINAYELAQIQLSTIAILRSDIWLYWLPVALLSLAFHALLRMRASEADPILLPVAVVLNGLGIAEIYRLDLARIAQHQSNLFAGKQVVWTCIAIAIAMLVVFFIPNHLFLRRYVYIATGSWLGQDHQWCSSLDWRGSVHFSAG